MLGFLNWEQGFFALGSVSGLVAWVDSYFWIVYVLLQVLEIFELETSTILYLIMCHGVGII